MPEIKEKPKAIWDTDAKRLTFKTLNQIALIRKDTRIDWLYERGIQRLIFRNPRFSSAQKLILGMVADRSFGWQKHADQISIKNFAEGVYKHSTGECIHGGTGLSENTIRNAIAELKALGVLFVIPVMAERSIYKIQVQALMRTPKRLQQGDRNYGQQGFEIDCNEEESEGFTHLDKFIDVPDYSPSAECDPESVKYIPTPLVKAGRVGVSNLGGGEGVNLQGRGYQNWDIKGSNIREAIEGKQRRISTPAANAVPAEQENPQTAELNTGTEREDDTLSKQRVSRNAKNPASGMRTRLSEIWRKAHAERFPNAPYTALTFKQLHMLAAISTSFGSPTEFEDFFRFICENWTSTAKHRFHWMAIPPEVPAIRYILSVKTRPMLVEVWQKKETLAKIMALPPEEQEIQLIMSIRRVNHETATKIYAKKDQLLKDQADLNRRTELLEIAEINFKTKVSVSEAAARNPVKRFTLQPETEVETMEDLPSWE